MPWMVGIDEAGYGPNLGPLVMTAVACRLADTTAADLWQMLRPAVRRPGDDDDGRILVEDSKLVYSTARGLLELERGVLACLGCRLGPSPWTLCHFLESTCSAGADDLGQEAWYLGQTPLPTTADFFALAAAGDRFGQACLQAGLEWGPIRCVVICPGRFNALLDRWGSKGAVLAHCLTELLTCNRHLDGPAEPAWFIVDKHGGRNHYAAMLQHALPDGLVVAEEEGMEKSTYQVLGLPRPLRLTFQPRADASHFVVALASMISKYLRELFMHEFNQFWQTHVPGLKPTAGYPGDAARFRDAVLPAAKRLGIADDALWRRK
jgi:hypothetical protein